MTHYEMIEAVCTGHKGEELSRETLNEMISSRFGKLNSTIIFTDYCYNRINKGIKFDKHLLVWLSAGKYEFVGSNYRYSGDIYWKPKGEQEQVVGKWKDGEYKLFDDRIM